jgi:tetratricopeptide (TPR) repeat protein
MLEVVATEAAKVLTADVSGVILSGSQQLIKTLLLRFKPSIRLLGQDQMREMILAEAQRDPQFAADVMRALAATAAPVLPKPTVQAHPGFRDRNEPRAAIRGPGVWLIAGGPGSGKTTLVKQIGADQGDLFPDGQVYLDCTAFRDGNSLLATEIKQFVLRRLGFDVIESAVPDVDFQYSEGLTRRSFILMIDNVLDRTEAETLTKIWPESLVLVTTRHLSNSLRVWGRNLIQLPGLDDAGAMELLTDFSDVRTLAAEPEVTRELLHRCDRIPLAIEYLGELIKRRSGERGAVATVLKGLAPAAAAGDVIEECVAQMFRGLSTGAQRGAALLSVHPDSEFSRAAATALLGDVADQILDELVDASMLAKHPVGRFQLYRLAGSYAAGEVAASRLDADLGEAFRRLLHFYRDRAVAADLAQGVRLRRFPHAGVSSWSEPGVDAIQWLDTEAGTLLALVAQAYERGFHEEVLQISGPMEVLLTNRGRHTLCAAVNEFGIRSAAHLRQWVTLARLHAMQLRIYTILHLFGRAVDELAKARELMAGIDDPQMESSLLEFEARLSEERALHDANPDYRPAIACMAAAVRIDRRTEAAPKVGLGLHLRMLANLLVKAGRPAEALVHLDEARANTETGRNAARIDTVAAKAYSALGQFPEAHKHLDRATALGAQAGATQYTAEIKEVEADIAVRSGDREAAAAALRWLTQLNLENSTQRGQDFLDQLKALPSPSPA